jgi:hypothetical protein
MFKILARERRLGKLRRDTESSDNNEVPHRPARQEGNKQQPTMHRSTIFHERNGLQTAAATGHACRRPLSIREAIGDSGTQI